MHKNSTKDVFQGCFNSILFRDRQQWYFNGNALPDDTGHFIVPQQTGDYYVIASEEGCFSGLSNILTVVISDVNNSTDQPFSFSVYPNPVDDVLNIVFPANGISKQILIYDVYGKLVFTGSSTLTHESINMGALAKGLYFIVLYMDNKMPVVRRVVKQ